MNSYLFEMSKKDERIMTVSLMLFALLAFTYLGFKVYDRQTHTPPTEQTAPVSKTNNLPASQPVGQEQPSRYNIQLR